MSRQLGMCAARLANIKADDFKGNQWSPPHGGEQVSIAEAAKEFEVGTRTAERARVVLDKGSEPPKFSRAVPAAGAPQRRCAAGRTSFTISCQLFVDIQMKSQTVLESLRRHMSWLQPQVHDEIIAGLHKDGLVDNDGDGGELRASAERRGMTLLRTPLEAAAASSNNPVLLRNIHARCRRYGYDLAPDQRVDLASANVSTIDRIALKSDMAHMNLIP